MTIATKTPAAALCDPDVEPLQRRRRRRPQLVASYPNGFHRRRLRGPLPRRRSHPRRRPRWSLRVRFFGRLPDSLCED